MHELVLHIPLALLKNKYKGYTQPLSKWERKNKESMWHMSQCFQDKKKAYDTCHEAQNRKRISLINLCKSENMIFHQQPPISTT